MERFKRVSKQQDFIRGLKPKIETKCVSDDPWKYMAFIEFQNLGKLVSFYATSDEGGTRSQARHRVIQKAMIEIDYR